MMSKMEEHHDNKMVRDGYATRSLDKSFPELKEFLSIGERVLDVGCGPGTITMGVAEVVNPGRVIGIDIAEGSIVDAREKVASASVTNVEFVAGNAYILPFGDGEFDMVYSHAFLQWLRDPVTALREQRRVAKEGGRVVSVAPCDAHTMFPLCPSLETVFEAWRHWADRTSEDFVSDDRLGCKLVDLLREAGFTTIETRPRYQQYRNLKGLVKFLLDENGTLAHGYKYLFDLDVLSQQTLERARKELEVWHADSARYYFDIDVLTIAMA